MNFFDELYYQLLKISIASLFKNSSFYFSLSELSEKEIYKLLSYSSILALSEDEDDIIKAYEIISRLLEIYGERYSGVLESSDLVLSRVGNFPGRELLRKRFFDGKKPELNLHLSLERIARETENFIDNGMYLTDFQYKLFSSLKINKVLSFSAPTSAGKSFVLSLDIVRKVREYSKECIVYIVPTRALITEVSSKIRQSFYDEKIYTVSIRTIPTVIDTDDIKNGLVYVLTQERLSSLLADAYGKNFTINSLIIDEAHEIQKGKRGIILQNTIETVIEFYPNVTLLFSSPLIKNPNYFIELFSIYKSSGYFIENISPVSQNIILASPVEGDTKKTDISFIHNNEKIYLGNIALPFCFRGSAKKIHPHFAKFISQDEESTIVFSARPSSAESVAIELANLCTDFLVTKELHNFIEFVKLEVHKYYSLVYCLTYGVGYHYGDMPSIIRSGIEQLFKSGDIKYIVCTSTLLQGVNLPAKHIIVDNPYSGDEPMRRADFLNLAGRAGRLLKEFHGNVWCIFPEKWDSKSFEGEKLQQITSAMSNVMFDGGEIILNLIDRIDQNDKEKELAEVAYAKLYHEIKGNNFEEPELLGYGLSGEPAEVLEYNFENIMKMKITVPEEILKIHKTVRPDHLQYLYDTLSSIEDIQELKLYSPKRKGGKGHIDKAIELIRDVFEWNISERFSKFISMLAYQWMKGVSMSSIIKYHVELNVSQPNNLTTDPESFIDFQKKVTRVVRRIFKYLEKHVRYELVRYIAIYRDMLIYVLKEKGYNDEADKIENVAAYLEFGSCDPTVLNIMSLGISRTSALLLHKKINFESCSSAEECLDLLRKINIDKLSLPNLCYNEISDVIRTS